MKKTKLETDYEVLLQGIEKLSVLTIGAYENTLEALKTLDLEIASVSYTHLTLPTICSV